MNNIHMPHIHIGLRTVKTVIVVFLSLCLAYVRQGFSKPLYIAIAAILCIQPTLESSKKAGANRLAATIIGGMWGIAIFVLNMYVFTDTHIIFKYAVISVSIIPLIYTLVAIKRPTTVSTASVVYLIVTASPVADMTNMQFVFNRLLDTFMGFLIAMAVNWISLPTEAELAAKKTAAAEKHTEQKDAEPAADNVSDNTVNKDSEPQTDKTEK